MKYALVDGSNVLHKVLYSKFYSSYIINGGQDIGALIGFVHKLKEVMDRLEPNHCIVVWDGQQKSERRRKLLPEYKIKADISNDAEALLHKAKFVTQRKAIHNLMPFLCVGSLSLPTKEADDVIAELVLSTLKDHEIVIVSDDSDFHQLISPDPIDIWVDQLKNNNLIAPFNSSTDEILFGFKQTLMKSITGDSSDCIPGVYGVGEKTVKDLMVGYKGNSVGSFFEHIVKRKGEGSRIDTLIENYDIVYRNYQLVKLGLEKFSDAERTIIDGIVAKCELFEFDYERVLKMFEGLQMEGVVREFDQWSIPFSNMASKILDPKSSYELED